jgi:membrane glycosyltransferase
VRLTPFDPTSLDPKTVTQRRTRIATFVLLVTLPAVLAMADLHWRTGLDIWKVAHLAIFTILFAQLSFGLAQAWTGFQLRRRGGDPLRIVQTLEGEDETVRLNAPTAVIMPICNEEVARVMEGVRAIYESLRANGRLTNCDFFILSDSPDPNHWVEEEAAWLALVQRLDAHGRIFYRKRKGGINKKAGNVADFCRRWGNRYRYMVVLDADSIISGEAVAKLVHLMERNPKVGLIQAVPILVNGETILARVQQFASRLYGAIFSAGLNYWQLGEANYWGHNAIIRVQPFIRHCSLPELPGDGPFGGRILSHDYVEAALMRRAGWQVWLATDLPGNYEECPSNLIDFAKRDRRWLQGNLQHTRLIGARGFHTVNRLHFVLGILSYVASPLWFVLLLLSCLIAYRTESALAVADAGRTLPWTYNAQAIALFGVTMVLLLLPKALAILDLRARPAEVPAFGGWEKIALSVVVETITFTLMAPILMLFHTKFVILTLCRSTITWGSQRRGHVGDSAWAEALAGHTGQTLFGLMLAVIAFRISPSLAWWMSPLLLGMIFSIPISVLTGSPTIGARFRQWGIFTTPEETQPGAELRRLTEGLALRPVGRSPFPELAADYALLQAVLDPYVNAVHVSLLRTKDYAPEATERRLGDLREKLLTEGPSALNARERVAVLSDVDSMVALHEEVWAAPSATLAQWWKLGLQHYRSIAPPPTTPFTRVAHGA